MSESQFWILVWAIFAAILIALMVAIAYVQTPHQYGDSVCIKVVNELKCEPITP